MTTNPGLGNLIIFATHEKMKTRNEIMGSPGSTHNTLYILNAVLIKSMLKDLTKHPEEVGVYLDPGKGLGLVKPLLLCPDTYCCYLTKEGPLGKNVVNVCELSSDRFA